MILVSSVRAREARQAKAAAAAAERAERWAKENAERIEREAAEREAKAAEKQARIDASKWLGEEGEKVTVSGTVRFARWIDGYYGASRLIVIDHGAGEAKTFTTAKWADDVEAGDEVTITGTVKRQEVSTYHETEGMKVTTLTRCKKA